MNTSNASSNKLNFDESSNNSKQTIWAVGGGKGGVGKSLLTANISICLALMNFKVIVIDLDLGGANLALYLGEKFILDRTVNDFLSKKYPTLDDIIIKGKYGPLLIGGDSSELGAANIHYARKMKLLKAIKNLAADFIVLDKDYFAIPESEIAKITNLMTVVGGKVVYRNPQY